MCVVTVIIYTRAPIFQVRIQTRKPISLEKFTQHATYTASNLMQRLSHDTVLRLAFFRIQCSKGAHQHFSVLYLFPKRTRSTSTKVQHKSCHAPVHSWKIRGHLAHHQGKTWRPKEVSVLIIEILFHFSMHVRSKRSLP